MLAAGTGTLTLQHVLAACGIQPTDGKLPGTNLPAAQPTTQPAVAGNPTLSPAGAPDLVVAHGGDPETIVRRALAAFGGMQRFVPKNANVIVKPNICVAYHTYEYAATTNPWVVGALVKCCLEAGASRVQVMDFPFGGTAEDAYVRSGIAEQVQAAGGEMVFMPQFKYKDTEIPQGVDLKKTKIFGDVLNADVLIDVPIAKHHGQARLTLGMKNLMGLVLNRSSIHANLGQRIADLTSLFRPSLTVVDAVRILMANGPSGGDLGDVKQLDTVIVSPDIVAADSYATTLFGVHLEDVAYIPAAAAMGLGRSDLQGLKIQVIET
jgi:uncharacterized protein (DUF362 family)